MRSRARMLVTVVSVRVRLPMVLATTSVISCMKLLSAAWQACTQLEA